ncbi:NIPSNAP family protein [Algoriphagus boritolerans]|uniref:NIPSNAP family protein n=1 Tax=Algoriphagus boritolerans TaxID=308111 RepID=UPI002FCE5DEA
MKKLSSLILAMLISASLVAQQGIKSKYFEMRTYTAAEGKMPDLIKRFQDHTLKLFKKNGIENVAYFINEEHPDHQLTFILGYPDEASRDVLWNKFANDPKWITAKNASEANGPLVQKVDQTFMVWANNLNDHKKNLKKSAIFQMRTYHCLPGRIENIQTRFRDHTRELFARQGLRNYPYWLTVEKDGAQPKLVYILGHNSKEAYNDAFKRFVADPDWIQARDASEADGKIVEKIDAVFYKALPFSPMK